MHPLNPHYITSIRATIFWPLSFLASDWRATVLIKRKPTSFPLFKRSQVLRPLLLCSKNHFFIIAVGEKGKSIWKNKQETQRKEGWDDIQPVGSTAGSTAAHCPESGLDLRAMGSMGGMVRFILHASWKYNEEELTTQQPTRRHPYMKRACKHTHP